jgi:type III pantothenate kinase
MLLAIDIGNTNIVFGLFSDEKLSQKWRLNSDKNKNSEIYAVDIVELFLTNGVDCLKISGAIISSVVPALTDVISDAVKKFYNGEILILGEKSVKLDIDIQVKNKKEVGFDRLVNSIAAFKKFGGNLIIIDFGTATTFDVVGENGEYLGGVISPGVNLSIKILHDMTAQLPKIQVKKQDHVIGKSTIEAMNSGIYFGYISLVEGLIKRIKDEYGKKMQVIITGGLLSVFENSISEVNYIEPDLTLEGLKMVYQDNQIS